MAKRLIVSRLAYINIDDIMAFNDLRNKSETYSSKFIKLIFQKFDMLTEQPYLGKPKGRGNYLLIWSSYCIYYKFDDEQLTILSVNHQKQNIR